MKAFKILIFFFIAFPYFSFATQIDEIIEDLSQAKIGECYKKIILPAKYETQEELIEIQKPTKKIIVSNPKFKTIKKKILIQEQYTDIKATMATFKKKKIKLPISQKKIYYTISKKKEIPLSDDFIEFLKKKGVKFDELKVGECFVEYVKLPQKKVVKKEYIKKQAYEIIDVEPPKFKTIKKKILIKPAYTKIIKIPAVYETKIEKILIRPAKKEFIKKDAQTICVIKKPAVYKEVVKKIMKSPPLTKVIKFPPTFKEIEVKVLVKPPTVTRRVVPQKKGYYDFFIEDQKPIYFWLKEDTKPDKSAKQTGLRVCKKETKVKYITKEIEEVISPATTKEIIVPPKYLELEIQKLVKEANSTIVELPAQYEIIKTQILISPSKVVWKRVSCEDDKIKAIK